MWVLKLSNTKETIANLSLGFAPHTREVLIIDDKRYIVDKVTHEFVKVRTQTPSVILIHKETVIFVSEVIKSEE